MVLVQFCSAIPQGKHAEHSEPTPNTPQLDAQPTGWKTPRHHPCLISQPPAPHQGARWLGLPMPVIKLRSCAQCGHPVNPNQRCSRCGQTHGESKRAERNKTHGYSRRSWRDLSQAAIQAHPWCEHCGATSDLTGGHVRYPARTLEDVRVECRSCNSKDARGTLNS